ncbi:MAG: phosphate regulon sensor histidine kinase PhoR [Rhodoferax sp.]
MFWRVSFFLGCLLGGGVAAWLALPLMQVAAGAKDDVLVGVLLGAALWFLIDLARGQRVMQWLRAGDFAEVAIKTGLWGELSERVRRLIRNREQATRDVSKRLQDFLAAFQASPNGVILLDARGGIEWFNQMAASHFGLDPKRDMLQQIGNLVRDPGFVSYFASHDYASELLMPGRESTPARPVRLSVHLYPYGEARLLLLSRDVTALEQADAMRRDFIANVSHEIRTPLTVLSGFVETMQSLPLAEPERERYLALMEQQTRRMQTLVSDLLTLSRLEGSPAPGAQDWVPMSALMRQLEQDARDLSAVLNPSTERLHAFSFECPPDVEIAGSGNELFSALSNLAGNAIRYTPADGKVLVRLALLSDGSAEFSVSDTGPGIAPEHLPRLTERFYRVDHSRSRDTGGTGLGLAIVKHVSQRHGAVLKIDSTPGKGSVFSITFPAARVRTTRSNGL